MKKFLVGLLACLALSGCVDKKTTSPILPTLPANVSPIKVNWKVIAEVMTIDGKQYLVMPYDGNAYVALSYPDSLIFRSWLNDVKRKNDQTNNILCGIGYVSKCKPKSK